MVFNVPSSSSHSMILWVMIHMWICKRHVLPSSARNNSFFLHIIQSLRTGRTICHYCPSDTSVCRKPVTLLWWHTVKDEFSQGTEDIPQRVSDSTGHMRLWLSASVGSVKNLVRTSAPWSPHSSKIASPSTRCLYTAQEPRLSKPY